MGDDEKNDKIIVVVVLVITAYVNWRLQMLHRRLSLTQTRKGQSPPLPLTHSQCKLVVHRPSQVLFTTS